MKKITETALLLFSPVVIACHIAWFLTGHGMAGLVGSIVHAIYVVLIPYNQRHGVFGNLSTRHKELWCLYVTFAVPTGAAIAYSIARFGWLSIIANSIVLCTSTLLLMADMYLDIRLSRA